jgi:hypothetical protein
MTDANEEELKQRIHAILEAPLKKEYPEYFSVPV